MSHLARFRFYEELNDFLPLVARKELFSYSFTGTPSVKDAIEAIGVPHVEVDMILVNGVSVDFSYKLRNDDTVSVYPVFESIDITGVTHLREKPLRELRFIADVHLGKLARYLRFCGLDTYYRADCDDREIISVSLKEKRAILTRDRGILRNHLVTHGYWLRSQNPAEQFREVLLRFDMKNNINMFTRCSICNTLLSEVSKVEISGRVLPKTLEYYDEFKICPLCSRIYWKGSHYEKMRDFVRTETAAF